MSTARSELRVALILGGVLVLVALAIGASAVACSVGSPPEGRAIVDDDREALLHLSSYCWNSRLGNAGTCAHGALEWSESPLVMSDQDTITFRFEGQSSVSLVAGIRPLEEVSPDLDFRIVPIEDVVHIADTGVVPVLSRALTFAINEPPGTYVIELYATFTRGDATYGLLVELTE